MILLKEMAVEEYKLLKEMAVVVKGAVRGHAPLSETIDTLLLIHDKLEAIAAKKESDNGNN